ncbi:MAG TPA: hypothetical protein VEZ14_10030 [Dehalococcoidia bacterium]|nr:hypothetical protein [Dehalococcoidia bacterium]
MPPIEPTNDLQRDLSQALGELQGALRQADAAAGAIQSLLPRLAAAGSLFDEMETLIRAGRERIGVTGTAPSPAYARPTLVAAPSAARPTPVLEPAFGEPAESSARDQAGGDDVAAAEEPATVAFRLEFESQPGPLDLRTVDDAVGEHPAVRDVALLDYDGRRATLKVWIVDTARPAEVQDALRERAEQLFGTANDVTIVALEDVA